MTENTNIEIKKVPQVCDLHYDMVRRINEVNNKLESMRMVKWCNGDEMVQEIPLNKAIELLLYDIKKVKENTSLWMDSTKILKSIGMYGKKHKYFLMFVSGLLILILSKEWFYKFINVLFK